MNKERIRGIWERKRLVNKILLFGDAKIETAESASMGAGRIQRKIQLNGSCFKNNNPEVKVWYY